MHDEERALSDKALDDEIARALAVEPSPTFLARVRTRIDQEPAPSAWRFGWMAGAVAAAAVIVLAVVAQRGAAPVTNTPPLVARTVVEGSTPTLPHVGSALGRTDHSIAIARPTARPEGRALRPEFALHAIEPEVLIDPREKAAIQRLMAGVRSGRVDLSPVLSATVPTAMDLPPVDDLVIAPISIEPLAPQTGAEGVRP